MPEQQCFTPNRPLAKDEIEEFNEKKIIVYPNPASFKVTIVPPNKENYKLILYDLLGRILYETEENNEEKIHINTQAFPNGIYYIKVIGNGKSFTEKLILKN